MKSGWLLTTVFVLFAAGSALAGEEAGPPVPFPPTEPDDFGVLLNWIMTAEPAACEQFIEEASAIADRNGRPEVEAQYGLLRAVAHEQDKISLIWRNFDPYDFIADDLETPPVYAATAAFRAGQLREDRSRFVATLGFAKARRRNLGGWLWILREGTWQKAEVDQVTEENFLRLNEDRLTYRGTLWFADLIPFSGAARFLVFLVAFFAVVRLVELPIVLKVIREVMQTSGRHSVRWWYIMAVVAVELISVIWAWVSFASWQFIFDLEKAPLLWLSSLTAADPFFCIAAFATLVVYTGLMLLYFYTMPMTLETRGRWMVEAEKAFIVVYGVLGVVMGLVMWFVAFVWPGVEAITQASINVFLLGLFLSGILLVMGCRSIAARWPARPR